jgi:hypothetical protein
MIDEIAPREQNGRDSLSRYKAQARSAAMAALSILKGGEIDRVYCDFHDDFVIRKKSENEFFYIFYQVKTKAKQNHLWTLNEVFGIKEKETKTIKQNSEDIKNSFVGKLLLHTINFDESCYAVIFQTNINNDDKIEELINDIKKQKFSNRHSKVLIDQFNDCYGIKLSEDEIKVKITKLSFETDVQHIKENNNNFEPAARSIIYEYSEIDLEYDESKEIILKLLNLVENKSCGLITELTKEAIEQKSSISIDDLLSILSISKEAYFNLLMGGDEKAIKNASIIQRAPDKSGANREEIEYCSRCKTNWDIWLRNNRHQMLELDYRSLTGKIREKLFESQKIENQVTISLLRPYISDLKSELSKNKLIFDLNEDLLLGGLFAELVRRQ